MSPTYDPLEGLEPTPENLSREWNQLKKERSEFEEYSDSLAPMNQRLEAEITSKHAAIQFEKAQRQAELAAVAQERASLQAEKAQLEKLRNEITSKDLENRETLRKIHESNKQAEELSETIRKERDECEDRRRAASNEISALDTARAYCRPLLDSYRQMLSSYIIHAGSDAKHPEMTDDMRRFVANDLLSQCAPETNDVPVGVSDEGKIVNFSEIENAPVQLTPLVATSASAPDIETAPAQETTVTEPILPEGKDDAEETKPWHEGMTKRQLVEHGKNLGANVTDKMNNQTIIETIEAFITQ